MENIFPISTNNFVLIFFPPGSKLYLIGTNRRDGGGTSSPTRGIFSCGYDGSSFHDEQDAVELATTGNSVDFGDAANGNRFRCGAGSSGHGGL